MKEIISETRTNLHFRQHLLLITICFGFSSIYAQWQFIGSPECSHPVYFDSEGDTQLVLTTAGLFYSGDTGSSWLPIQVPDTLSAFEEIQIERGALYLTTHRYIETRRVYDVFRSDDWGATWILLNGQLDLLEGLIQLVIKADTLYYTNRKHIYLSFDKGDHFTSVIPSPGQYSTYDIHHHRLYAKVSLDQQNLLLRSSDDGLTWDTLDKTTQNIFISDVNSIEGVLWKIVFFNGSHYCRIEKSYDDGDTWTTTGYIDNLQEGFFDRSPKQIIGLSGQLYVITELSGKTIYHSADGGINWSEKSRVSSEVDINFSKDRLFFTSFRGLYESQDHGESSDEITNGLEAATVLNTALSGSSIWVTSNDHIHSLSPANVDWQNMEGYREIKSTRDGHLLAIAGENAYVSADEGENWTEITYEDLGLSLAYPMLYIMCAGDIMYIASSSGDLFYSTDYGESWHLSEVAIAHNLSFNGKYVIKAQGKLMTSDDGVAWTLLPQPEHPDLQFHLQYVHYMDPFYFTDSYNLTLRLHKDSTAWEEVIEPFSDVQSHTLSMLSHNDVLFITVFGEGVFGSKDHGQTWYAINEGLTNYKTVSLTKDSDFLYLGTEGGLWKRPLNELAVSIYDPVLNKPSNTSCLITDDYVSLDMLDGFTESNNVLIFSADGRLVFYTKSGDESVDISMRDFPSGMYYINVLTSNGPKIMRVIKY